jgi:hypothetical protein
MFNQIPSDFNNSGTYVPYVQDNKFSQVGKFTGIPTDTTGFNSLIVNINSSVNSTPAGFLVQYSDTGTDFDSNNIINYSTVYYSDTIESNKPPVGSLLNTSNTWTKNYPIIKQYYRIVFIPEQLYPVVLTISSRLSVCTVDNQINSVSSFTNEYERAYDSVGKLRISYPKTLLDINYIGTGITGTTGFINNYLQTTCGWTGIGLTGMTGGFGSLILGATGQTKITCQSRKYCTVQPEKSLLFVGSGVIGYIGSSLQFSGPTGFYNKIGYFDDVNGLFFEYTSTTNNYPMSIVIRSNGLDQKVNQNAWSIDKMDGLGISGLKLNFVQTQIFLIDMDSLNGGRIRFGFYAYGKINYCHIITNVNVGNSCIISNINLPIRYEIDGLTGATGSVSLTQISSTVISEGGYNPIARPFSVNGISDSLFLTETPIIGLRGGGQNYYHQNIYIKHLNIGTSIPDILLYRLRLYLDPVNGLYPATINTWLSVDNFTSVINGSLSVVQYATDLDSGFSTDNSIILDQGTIISKGGNTFTDNLLEITSNYFNISNIMILTIQNISNVGTTGMTCATVGWDEIY